MSLKMAPDYDHLTLMQKVEVFEHALEHTQGDDLAKILWFKSPSSEVLHSFISNISSVAQSFAAITLRCLQRKHNYIHANSLLAIITTEN